MGLEVDLAVVGGSGDGAVVEQFFCDVEGAFRGFYTSNVVGAQRG